MSYLRKAAERTALMLGVLVGMVVIGMVLLGAADALGILLP